MVAVINLKFEDMTSRKESSNGGSASGLTITHKVQISFKPSFPNSNFQLLKIRNPSEWIYKCDRFFKINGIGDHEKVGLTSLHLEGRALE